MQLEKYNYNTINYKYCCFLFLCSGTILMKTSGYQVNRTCYQGLYELKTTFKTKHSHDDAHGKHYSQPITSKS